MRTIEITDNAKKNIADVTNYLISNWSIQVAKKFSQKLNKTVKLIQNQPEIFPVTVKKRGLRKCVVTKQSTLYYFFDINQVVVISLFDTRQNPNKINKI